jgi:hypothetical protein
MQCRLQNVQKVILHPWQETLWRGKSTHKVQIMCECSELRSQIAYRVHSNWANNLQISGPLADSSIFISGSNFYFYFYFFIINLGLEDKAL